MVCPRKPAKAVVATGAALASSLCLAAAAFGLPPFTTAPKSAPGSGGQVQLSNNRTGCHATFDRFVFQARFGTPSYRVRYVRRIIEDGSGNTVNLLGSKRLRVVIREARGHTQGGSNLLTNVITPRCSNLRQVKVAGDFEGIVTFGLGLRRKTGFRVFRLTDPRRLVIDVAH
jgi:hypothetical protein